MPIKRTCFVNWLITTKMLSFPLDNGNPSIKIMGISSQFYLEYVEGGITHVSWNVFIYIYLARVTFYNMFLYVFMHTFDGLILIRS